MHQRQVEQQAALLHELGAEHEEEREWGKLSWCIHEVNIRSYTSRPRPSTRTRSNTEQKMQQ